MLSASVQKARPFASLGAVAHLPEAARVRVARLDKLGQGSIAPHGHDRLEGRVDLEPEQRRIGAHPCRVGLEAQATVRQRERLSKFARDRIACLAALRRAAEAKRAERGRKAQSHPENHSFPLPTIEPAGANARRRLDLISRDRAQEAATIVALLILAIAIAIAVIGEGAGLVWPA